MKPLRAHRNLPSRKTVARPSGYLDILPAASATTPATSSVSTIPDASRNPTRASLAHTGT
ncbi:hypothetical protein GO497_09600 [Acidovorax citrulli]|nr:hypothetical protein [Paracidovorax citrulli]